MIDCKVCNKTLKDKPNLKKHIKLMHPKTHRCESCDETFTDSWKMEEHLELHGNERPFKCSICEKGFYMKWRMEKHTRDHSVDIKFCHYFNNDKPCPYDKIGCKFKHELSPECRYNLNCTSKLCQFTHTTKNGEELVHRQVLETHNEVVEEDYEESYSENDYDDGEDDSLTDMEKEDSDSSDEEEIDPNQYGLGRMLQKFRQLEGKSHLREENDYQDQC